MSKPFRTPSKNVECWESVERVNRYQEFIWTGFYQVSQNFVYLLPRIQKYSILCFKAISISLVKSLFVNYLRQTIHKEKNRDSIRRFVLPLLIIENSFHLPRTRRSSGELSARGSEWGALMGLTTSWWARALVTR